MTVPFADPCLPQLAEILDETRGAAELAKACLDASGRWDLQDSVIGHVRYRPGKNCLVRYDVTLLDRQTNTAEQHMWYGLAYTPGSSETRWRAAVAKGSGAVHCEGLGMVAWKFPDDRKLANLRVLLDSERLANEVFRPVLPSPEPGPPSVVRYIPEHGCTVRVRSGDAEYYAKVQQGGSRASQYANALGREAWEVPGLSVTVQRAIAGAIPDGGTELEACGEALARLHTARIPGIPEAADWSQRLARSRTLLGPRVEGASDLIGAIADSWQPSGHVVTLHGDLHLKNFLVHQGHAELIDLDTLQRGDPLDDLGSFAASLYHRALLEDEPLETAEAAGARFFAAYRSCMPWPVDEDRFQLAVARALIAERACRAVTRCKGDVADPLAAIARGLVWRRDGATPRSCMEGFAMRVRARRGHVMDVSYRTFLKAESLPKSHATVAWEADGTIRVEQIGPHPRQWQFPGDPEVPSIAVAADPSRVLQYLPVPGATRTRIDVLTYRPANRLTARYRAETPSGPVVVYGKTYCDDRGAVVHERLRTLQDLGFPMPVPLGYSQEIRTVWQSSFDGQPFDSQILGESDEALWREAASRLFFLHRSGIVCPPRMTLEQQLADTKKKMSKLAMVSPEQRDTLRSLVESLTRLLPELEPAPTGVVHGDFHVRQMMVSGGQVALFDFDEIAAGDLTEDFGHFIADLHTYGRGADWARTAAAAMTQAYENAAGGPLPPRRLRWHIALQLLTRAYRAMLQLRPDFDSRVSHFIGVAKETV